MVDKKKIFMLGLIVSLLPVWRSGEKGNLTFWGFVGNHTIFSDPVEYVPKEDYQQEMSRLGRRAT